MTTSDDSITYGPHRQNSAAQVQLGSGDSGHNGELPAAAEPSWNDELEQAKAECERLVIADTALRRSVQDLHAECARLRDLLSAAVARDPRRADEIRAELEKP